jgi:electron transport complex protein RnfC
MPAPAVVTIPMSMNIGAPAKPIVKPGDEVKVGQLIAEAGGFVSSPIHSSVSGKVKKVDEILMSNGQTCQAITIESDGLQTVAETVVPPQVDSMESFIAAVRNSGVVGLGGAGFPVAVKLNVTPGKVDYICINGAECEPYITADTRTMLDKDDLMLEGIQLLQKYLQPGKVLIGVEDNKPQCISHLKDLTDELGNVEVKALPALYPQGGEKVLIYHLTHRIVPEGKLPIDVGCVVINPTTLVAITNYIKTGMPLVEKCITVDGSAIANPMNVLAPIGSSVQDVVDFTGGLKCEAKKVIFGGLMMGISMSGMQEVVMKNTNAILCMNEKDATPPKTTPCIKCGRCINHCPLKLMPANIETAFNLNKPEELKELKVNLCMECGCCSFICPAKRPLVQTNKMAKAMLNKYNAEQKAAAEKAKAKEEAKEAAK